MTDRGPTASRGSQATGGGGTRRTSGAARAAGAPPPAGAGPGAGRRGAAGVRGGPAPGSSAACCVALIVFVGVVTALATWVAAVLLGVLSPGAAPPMATAVAVVVVLVVVVILGGRVVFAAVRPLADVAAASDRLADGEPGVRVTPRGPVPVRRLGASFNAMAERLDRSRDDRRALLADVTHELRTPLTVISGGLEAMLDGVHPMDEDHISPILAEAAVMDRLLDDLRTISLAEAGALPLHREPVDLVELAADVLVLAAHGRRRPPASRWRSPATTSWRQTSTRCACARSSSTSSPTRSATRRRTGG